MIIRTIMIAALAAASAAGGQSRAAAPPAPARPSPSAAGASPGEPVGEEIVVSGRNEKRSRWARAEAEHVVVISDGSEAELARVTKNLELLYHLMSRLYRHGDESDDTAKLQVTLFGSASPLRETGLQNLRALEGPFAAGLSNQRYYDPREDGAVLAIARSDQIIKLNTRKAYNYECENNIADDGNGDTSNGASCGGTNPDPLVRKWEAVLYSSFAQHFILTYTQAVYPRWYVDGIGALFSTFTVRNDGSIDYALAPRGYTRIFHAYGRLRIGDVLTGRYLHPASDDMEWTPYHAWLLAHFFTYSNLKPERRRQFLDYMTAVHRGRPMAEAAGVFGDLRKLQREIDGYASLPTSFARTARAQASVQEPLVTELSLASAALIEAKLEVGTLASGAQSAPGTSPGNTPGVAARLARIRAKVSQLPSDPGAMLVAAEAECRTGSPRQCLTHAESVLAKSPDDVRALAWKGVALTDEAIAAPPEERARTLAAARRTFEQAIELDGRASLPRIGYFQSFTKAGEPAPEPALVGMAAVVRSVPAAPGPRLFLGQELVRQGKAELARQVLRPLLYGADDSPEARTAKRLFSSSGGDRGPIPAGESTVK